METRLCGPSTDLKARARGLSAFLVDLHAPDAGVHVDYETLLGGHGTADLRFENVSVPAAGLGARRGPHRLMPEKGRLASPSP
jgi:alkylation response protein AidB-like acyl-CoA dehydrogenase